MKPSPKEVLSPAQILELVRAKVSQAVLYPVVIEKIDALKRFKAIKSQETPDREYRTIFHADLIRAIMTAVRIESFPSQEAQCEWTATIHGIDTGGEPLTVMVEVSKGSDPLKIADFSIDQP